MKRFVALCLMAVAFVTAPAFSADLWDSLWGNSNEVNFDKALKAFKSHDDATALRELHPLAEQGDARAQFYLALMYKNGRGVPEDYKTAVKWYTLSAEQEYAKAQYNLGILYKDGEGVPQDYKEAVKWWRLSAEQGYAKAQNNLGASYGRGQGVLQDYGRAHMWYNIAASNGEEKSVKNRDSIAEKMTPEQVEKAQNLARKCLANNYQGC